jgi:hypothetical protein
MTPDQAISLYLKLTSDIHTFWAAFGALFVLIIGWMLSRKSPLQSAQRFALSIGWLSAAGYLGSSLMNRYALVTALAQDLAAMKSDLQVLRTVADLGPLYANYRQIVWVAMGALALAALVLIWSNVAAPRLGAPKSDA